MNENYYEEEREIDLVHFLYYLLTHWRTLLAVVVLGAVVGGGIYGVKEASRPEPVIPESVEVNEETGEVIGTDYEVSPDVKANMELAFQYRQLYKKQLEYNQKSAIMQMNPGAVYNGELEYYVSAGYDTGEAAIRYQNILSGRDVLLELKEAAALPYEEQYIRELVNCSISRENDSTININNQKNFTFKNAVITFSVNAADEEACEKMLQVIREKVEEVAAFCAEAYDEFEAVPLNDDIRLVTNADYLNRQRANIDQLNNYRANMSSLESGFAGKDLVYYNQVYLSREYVLESEEPEEQKAPESVVPEEEPENPVKWLIIGIFLGCFAWGGFYLVKYLMDPHVKMVDEIKDCYHIPLIGAYQEQTSVKKGIDGWLDRMFRRKLTDSEEYIVSAIQELDYETIYLSGEDEEAGNALKQRLQECCSNLQSGDWVYRSSKALDTAKRADGIIMIVQVGKTVHSEIRRELEVCRMQKIPVIGSVAIEIK